MKTVKYIKRLFAVCIYLIVPLLSIAQNELRPNFIQILTDDQGWGDLGAYGHQFIQTPNIDMLAQEGIKFTSSYSAHPVCSPSRAAIITGRTPYRNGVYRWIPANHFCYLHEDEVTLPQLLRKGGYQTAHFGKWHLSYYNEKRIRETYDYEDFTYGGELVGQPGMNDYGYDYWFASGNVARPDHKNPKNFFLNGEALGKLEGFSAQLVANEFVKWIKQYRKTGEPFFITVWFHEPHGPVNSAPEFVERYKKMKVKQDSSMIQYLANVTQIDEAVGTIIKSLKEVGVYDNTLIWYTSDNGPEGAHEFGSFNTSDSPYGGSRYRGQTGGFSGRKRSTHEGGVRVPGIISWPVGLARNNVKPGNVNGIPVIGSDVFPTLLELAGLNPPVDVKLDGISIVPVLEGKPFKRSKPLYWRNEHSLAMRDGNWKMVGDPLRKSFELYNLSIDHRETTDLSAFEPEVFERMKKKLIEYDREVLAEGPDWYKRESRYREKVPVE